MQWYDRVRAGDATGRRVVRAAMLEDHRLAGASAQSEREMTDGLGERLALLFLLGALLLNFPILAIFNQAATLGGIPVLYLYLFGVWAAGIVVAFVLARRW
jgi:hypothetical protein